MPRAVDPSLNGGGVPVDHNPLIRMPTSATSNFDLEKFLEEIANALPQAIATLLFPAIEKLTGVDLSAFLPLLNLLHLDFSSPEAFLLSLVDAIIGLPEALVMVLTSLIEQLLDPGNPDQLTSLLSGLIELLASLPELLMTLLTSLIDALTGLTGVDLSALLSVFTGLDLSDPIAFLTSLAEGLLSTGAGLLGGDSPLDALNLFNLVPTDLLSHLPMSNIGEFVTNLITDGDFLDATPIEGWIHNLTGGFGGTGSRTVTADGTTHELFGNLIPVSAGQVLPLSGMAKWSGLAGSGNPVQLAVTGYKNGVATLQQIVASHNTIPPTTDWTTLTGQFTVPANVDSVRTRLVVANTATAGQVSFSKIGATKIGPMLQRLIAGTNAGEFLPDDIGHLFSGIITNATDLLSKVAQGDFDGLVTTLTGDIQAGFEDVGDVLESFLTGASPLNGSNINAGAIADEFVPAVGGIIDTTVANVSNVIGSGFTLDSVGAALQSQTNALVSAGSGITSLFARLTNLESKVSAIPPPPAGTPPGSGTAFGGAVGIYDSDDFERTSTTSLGAGWTPSYAGSGSGVWATPNGHDASFITGSGDREFLEIRANAKTATDYQRVTVVISAASTRFYDPLLGTYNYTGHNDVWLRISDASTSLANVTGVRIRFGGDGSCSITRFTNGTPTALTSKPAGSIAAPGPGATLIGEAGNIAGAGTLRYFRGIVGSTTRIEYPEVGTGSSAGATFRRFGHGGRAEGHLLPLPGQESPGSLHYATGMDQTTGSSGAPGAGG